MSARYCLPESFKAQLAMREHIRCAFNELIEAGFKLSDVHSLMQSELNWRFSPVGRRKALMPTPGYENHEKGKSIEKSQ